MGLRGFQGSGCILADDMVRFSRLAVLGCDVCSERALNRCAGPGQDAAGHRAAVDASATRHGRPARCQARHNRLPDISGVKLVRVALKQERLRTSADGRRVPPLQGFRVREVAEGPRAHDAAGGVHALRRHLECHAVPVAAHTDSGACLQILLCFQLHVTSDYCRC